MLSVHFFLRYCAVKCCYNANYDYYLGRGFCPNADIYCLYPSNLRNVLEGLFFGYRMVAFIFRMVLMEVPVMADMFFSDRPLRMSDISFWYCCL